MMKWVLLVALLGAAHASCPNSCSGHGTCNSFDQCTCFQEEVREGAGTDAEWTGADCSLRTCPRGISWVSASGTCSHESEQECSDQGVCDRSTGLCTCFGGYIGSACQRTECPNDCSGHGTCRSNRDFAYDWAVAKSNEIDGEASVNINSFEGTYLATYEDAWDSGMHYGCLCDNGYRGPDCSLIECPSTTDPMDDKCVDSTAAADVFNFQIQLDVAVGAAGWDTAYADTLNDYVLDDGVLYSCYGSQAGQDCSGRGVCDYSTGSCECFSGYAGTACEDVSELS